MGDSTGISWSDATFNPWVGCEKVSPGCLGARCYAETLVTGRMGRPVTWGADGVRERTSASLWAKPVRWNRLAAERRLPDGSYNEDGHRPRVFCASLADVFEPRPELEPWRRDLFALIAETPNLDWLVLTKRPEEARDWLREAYLDGWGVLVEPSPVFRDGIDWGMLPNVWIGTSIENARHTWRADVLREIPAAVRFISAEPLLGSLYPSGPIAGASPDSADGLSQPDAGSIPVGSTQDRVLPGTPGGVTVQPDAESAVPDEERPHAGARLSDPRSEIDRSGDAAARGRASLDLSSEIIGPNDLCPDCRHPITDHGADGCDWEVSDWGTLDCGCRRYVETFESSPGSLGYVTAAPEGVSGARGRLSPGNDQDIGLSKGGPSRPGRAPLKLSGIDWVIVGGESQKDARPMELAWAIEIIDAARQAGTSFHMKQMGAVLGRALGGGSHGGDVRFFPAILRVQEFPETRAVTPA